MLRSLLLLIVVGCAVAHAQDTERAIAQMFGRTEPYKLFFQQLQQAARTHDRDAMLQLVEYPLHIQSKPPRLLDETALREQFDHVFDERLLQILSEQQFEQLQISNAGIAFGHGDLWFGGVCQEASCEPMQVRILRIGPDEKESKRRR